MKKSKSLLKNLQKSDKDYEISLKNSIECGNLSASALLALGSIDDTGSITNIAQLFQEINNSFDNYTNQLFKSRKLLDELISQEDSYTLVDKDRQLLISQVIKASSKKSNNGTPDKLLDAQRELRACQTHLSEIEVDLMINRQRIINSSIEGKLNSMVELGEKIARFADQGLEHIHSIPTSANLLENPSIDSLSPSQSASQVNVDTNIISSPLNIVKNSTSRRESGLKSRFISETHQPQHQPKPSMFTEQFSESSIHSPSPKPSQPQRQPLIPQSNQSQQQQKPGGFLKRLFGSNKKQSNHIIKQDKQSKSNKKNLFNVPWGSKSSNHNSDKQSKQIDGWHTRTTSNITSLERGDSSDEDVGNKYVTVKNKNPQAAIAENLSRQSSVASSQSQNKKAKSSKRFSQDVVRSNSLGNSKRALSLPERPSSAASLPLNVHSTKQTKRSSKSTTSPQNNNVPPKLPSKNGVSNGSVQRKRPNSTSQRNRKVVIHPNLMSIVEGDGNDQDFNPSPQSNGVAKSKGKEREHLPTSSNNSRHSSANSNSIPPIRKNSNRSTRSEQLHPKNVSWAQSIPQRSMSSQWSNRSSKDDIESSDDEDNDNAYNIARAQLSPLDFSTLK